MDVAAQLLMCPSLQTLDLSDNAIGGVAAEALGNLVSRGAIRKLDLSHNAVGSSGALAIERGLELSGHRCEVDLGFNIIIVSRHDSTSCAVVQRYCAVLLYPACTALCCPACPPL
eukprot:TRINITY_DN4293_c0_g1_i15.p3 TRINITY_DN4293_c0_g1~~TRINITY_DN4293_c0_g1_i15.p3  ORF type:complete len:115 (-),score=21.23 TRINITY_DN4293_c0_g1_i15:88-432(-)